MILQISVSIIESEKKTVFVHLYHTIEKYGFDLFEKEYNSKQEKKNFSFNVHKIKYDQIQG